MEFASSCLEKLNSVEFNQEPSLFHARLARKHLENLATNSWAVEMQYADCKLHFQQRQQQRLHKPLATNKIPTYHQLAYWLTEKGSGAVFAPVFAPSSLRSNVTCSV